MKRARLFKSIAFNARFFPFLCRRTTAPNFLKGVRPTDRRCSSNQSRYSHSALGLRGACAPALLIGFNGACAGAPPAEGPSNGGKAPSRRPKTSRGCPTATNDASSEQFTKL